MPVGQQTRIKKSGKMRNKLIKPVQLNYGDVDPKLQFNIPKGVEDDKKVRPKDVFEGFKESKKSSNRKNVSSNKKKK